jgi:hypothetical protein
MDYKRLKVNAFGILYSNGIVIFCPTESITFALIISVGTDDYPVIGIAFRRAGDKMDIPLACRKALKHACQHSDKSISNEHYSEMRRALREWFIANGF